MSRLLAKNLALPRFHFFFRKNFIFLIYDGFVHLIFYENPISHVYGLLTNIVRFTIPCEDLNEREKCNYRLENRTIIFIKHKNV